MQVLQRPDDLETSSGNPSLQSIVGSDTNPSVHACSVDTSYATPTSPRYMRTSRREPHIHAAVRAAAAGHGTREATCKAPCVYTYTYVCPHARAMPVRVRLACRSVTVQDKSNHWPGA
jgi:hypothetical protein